MSLPACCHGYTGIGWDSIGSFAGVFLWHWHVGQFVTIRSMSPLIPGQKTVSRALCLHFSSPKWPSWMLSSIFGLSFLGIMILFTLKRIPSVTVISSRWFQYLVHSRFSWDWVSDQPSVTFLECKQFQILVSLFPNFFNSAFAHW